MSPRPAGIKDLNLGKKTSMCIYADTGVGKTRLIGGGGASTLILRPPTDNTDSIRAKPAPKEWVISDHAALAEAHDYLRAEGEEWDWVWWDGVSLWQEVGLDDVFQAAIDR